MPVTNEIISGLKQSNVSKDIDKTKQRVKEDFLASKNKQKTAIVELSGLKRTSIYRVFREGAVSAKIVLSMAQILNVAPNYYTGETEERGSFSDEQLQAFLIAKGYPKLAHLAAAPRKSRSDAKSEKDDTAQQDNLLFSSAFSNSAELEKAVSEIDSEEAVQLLRALLIRAKAGGKAAQTAELVKRCLMMQ
ncbi:MAG: hypothetical protein FWG31_02620 [Oscillospiraceae bacterium]|nr:hypothetical protein [Oscillospiraceae bacterium]